MRGVGNIILGLVCGVCGVCGVEFAIFLIFEISFCSYAISNFREDCRIKFVRPIN